MVDIGKTYRVLGFADEKIGIKLLGIGIIPGKLITPIRRSPVGGAYYVKCENKRIGISSSVFESLHLEIEDEDKAVSI
jgi:Fe2+ transport system protein FeoA